MSPSDHLQPTHDGSIVQLGWNAGPRHARVWGLSKSYVKKIDDAGMIDRDSDAIATITMVWGLIMSHMPHEVLDEVNTHLVDSGMPRMATRNISEGE